MKRDILSIFILLSLMAIAIVLPMAVFATPREGDICTTDYMDTLVGSDGQYFYRPGAQTSIKYNSDGSTSTFLHQNYDGPRKHSLIISQNQESYFGYCIEQGLSFPDAQQYAGAGWQSDNYFNSFPQSARTGIMEATIFGRQPDKSIPVPGCNDDDWYWATQTIIWEYQQQLRTTPTNIQGNGYVPANYFLSTLAGRPAEKCYDYILSAMAEHEKIPSFASFTSASQPLHVLKWNDSKSNWRLAIKDENKCMESFKTLNQNVKIEQNGVDYIFTATSNLVGETIECKKNIALPSQDMLIWGGDTETQAIATGTADPMSFYINVRTERPGTLEILKTSENGEKVGFSFQIQSQGGTQLKYETDLAGLIRVPLLPGEYIISEQESSKYRHPQDFVVQIIENSTTNLQIDNLLKKGKIRIQKSMKDTLANTTDPEPGAVFQIYPTAYLSYESSPERLKDKLITDEQGITTTKELPLGSYILHQITASKNTTLSADLTVNIDEDLQTTSIPIENTVQKGKIEVKKTNTEATPLPGAVFTVRAAEDINLNNILIHRKNDLLDVLVTRKDGTACTNWLPPGKYILEEIIEPKGYLPPQNPFTEVELTPINQTDPTFITHVTIENRPVEIVPVTIENRPVQSMPDTGDATNDMEANTATSFLLISITALILLIYWMTEQNKTRL